MIFQDKTMFIARGVPGSGKSFAIRKLQLFLMKIANFYTFSTDDYWIGENGYEFNPNMLHHAHEWNQKRVETACQKSSPFIAVDNTNTTIKEMKPYLYLAKFWGYEVCMVYPNTEWALDANECAKRNEHDVPQKTIQKMLDRFQNHGTIELNTGKSFSKLMIG